MNLRLIKMIAVFCLAICVAQGAFAQKDKSDNYRIKNRTKVAQSDSTKSDSLPKTGGGKASIKNRVVVIDSARAAVTDSLVASTMAAKNESDSTKAEVNDSLLKPRKRFYTRVKENDLTAAESRAQGMRLRIEMAEERLAEYRNGSAPAESIQFSAEELDVFAVSIAMSKEKLSKVDSSLLAVRTKLADEGRLNVMATEPEGGGAGSQEGDMDEEDDDGELKDPTAQPSGKAALKNRGEDSAPPSGKSSIKRKRQEEKDREEDIDD
jgi:hypothetical protein